ncbi:unnamed protein product [Diplocarpon coronariae]
MPSSATSQPQPARLLEILPPEIIIMIYKLSDLATTSDGDFFPIWHLFFRYNKKFFEEATTPSYLTRIMLAPHGQTTLKPVLAIQDRPFAAAPSRREQKAAAQATGIDEKSATWESETPNAGCKVNSPDKSDSLPALAYTPSSIQ